VSREQNIALALRYYDECPRDDGDPAKKRALRVADEILSDDFTLYYNDETDSDAMHGRDAHKEFLIGHTAAFSGERWSVETVVGDEDTVACLCRGQATDSETHNPIDVLVADFFTLRDGRLAALRRFLDFGALAAQRSAVTETEPAST
jgi:ketosteroid isomerase-like protein